MKENIDNDEKMMPFHVHDNRRSYSGKLSNYAYSHRLWRLWPPTSDFVIPTLLIQCYRSSFSYEYLDVPWSACLCIGHDIQQPIARSVVYSMRCVEI